MSDAKPKSDLGPRVVTAAIGVPLLFLLAFRAPNYGLWLFYTAAAAIGAWEYGTMALGGRLGAAGWAAIAGTAATLSAAYWAPGIAVYAAVGAAVVAIALSAAFTGDVAETDKRLGGALGAFAYCATLFGGLLALVAAQGDARMQVHPTQAAWMLFPMAVVWAGDTGAYFAGRAFGRHKLAPRLSPKKTWEGAFGGAVASVLGGMGIAAWLLPDLGTGVAVALALPGALLGQAGDLVESGLKRATGVKDSGRIIYGHGGLLDRVDALVFAAPYFAIAKALLGA